MLEPGRLSADHDPQGPRRLSVHSQFHARAAYTGDDYLWPGTLVYDGQVYDHIHYRARGGVWRYAMGKNMWKFDFNRGHEFQARDNYGNAYDATWNKLNLGASIQQGDYWHRGEQGLFESVGFKLFNLAGVRRPTPTSSSSASSRAPARRTAANQYDERFPGAVPGRRAAGRQFLDEHDLPDGNLYKMERRHRAS